MMRVHFCKSNDPLGRLIRLATFSRWNHVIVQVDGWAYDAMAFKGVRKFRPQNSRWQAIDTVEIPVSRAELASVKGFLEAQVGKPYDWMALVALPFRTSWQSPHKWFCSELGAKAVVLANVPVGPLPGFRVKPSDLWVVLRLLVEAGYFAARVPGATMER